MRKKVGIIKRLACLLLVFLLSIESFAAIVSDNDGSAFITKREFDALKHNFSSQIKSYNDSIDNKSDGAIASYLAGLKISTKEKRPTLFSGEIVTYSEDDVSRWWKPSQPKGKFYGMMVGSSNEPDGGAPVYNTPQIVTWESTCNGKKGKQTVITYSATGTRDTSLPVFSYVGEDWLDEIQFNSTNWKKDRNAFRPIKITAAENGVRFSRSGDLASFDGYTYTDSYGQKAVYSYAFKMMPFSINTSDTGAYYVPTKKYGMTSQSAMPPPTYKNAATDTSWKKAYTSNGEHPLSGISSSWVTATTRQTYSAKRQVALNYASQKLLVFDHDYDTGWKMPYRVGEIEKAYSAFLRTDYGYWFKYGYSCPYDYWNAMKPDTWVYRFSYNDYQAEGPGKYGAITVNSWPTLPDNGTTTTKWSQCFPPLMAGWPYLMDMSSIYSNIKIPKDTGPLPTGAVEKSDGNYYLKWTAGTPLCYVPDAGNVTFKMKSDSTVDLWVKLAPFSNGNPNSDTAVFDRSKINLTNSTTQTRAVRLPSGESEVSFNVPSACYVFLKWSSTSNWKDGGTLQFPTEYTFIAE